MPINCDLEYLKLKRRLQDVTFQLDVAKKSLRAIHAVNVANFGSRSAKFMDAGLTLKTLKSLPFDNPCKGDCFEDGRCPFDPVCNN